MRHMLAAALLLVAALAQPALGQDVTAEVRTWDGQALDLLGPTFEVFYTIVLPEAGGATAAAAPGGSVVGSAVGAAVGEGTTTAAGVGGLGAQGIGSMQASVGRGLLPTGPDAVQGRRQQEYLTLTRAGVETRVPISELAALVFSRQRVVGSALPPWAAPGHFHYAATAVFTSGTQLQADYVNLGTSILRGTSAHGVVDVPWTEIEIVRFRR